MQTPELFDIITKLPEFKKYPRNRGLKYDHKRGTLTQETYDKLFEHFGYVKNVHWALKEKNI